MGNPAAGVVLLLIALYLLLALFQGRLEWLFHLDDRADSAGPGGDLPDDMLPFPVRPWSVGYA